MTDQAGAVVSLREHLPGVAIVYDKFHVMKHVNHAIDETRRQEFFRQGGRLRSLMRGRRWLLLTRRHNLSRRKRGLLDEALSLNRRLFKAYYLKEQVERLWSYTYEGATQCFFQAWLRSLRWQRLAAFKKLARTLESHLEDAEEGGVEESLSSCQPWCAVRLCQTAPGQGTPTDHTFPQRSPGRCGEVVTRHRGRSSTH